MIWGNHRLLTAVEPPFGKQQEYLGLSTGRQPQTDQGKRSQKPPLHAHLVLLINRTRDYSP